MNHRFEKELDFEVATSVGTKAVVPRGDFNVL
jgi:hypothetical protein